jgi:hypothetical protein
MRRLVQRFPNLIWGRIWALTDMNDLTRSTVVLIAIPLLSILIPSLLTWAKDLRGSARRIRLIEEQSKLVTFWENWMRVESSVLPGDHTDYEAEGLISAMRSVIRRELADAGQRTIAIYKMGEVALFRHYRLTFRQFRRYRASLSSIRRALLLYEAPNPLAKSRKVFFHIILVENLLGAGLAVCAAIVKNQGWTSSLPSFLRPQSPSEFHPVARLVTLLFLVTTIVSTILWIRYRAVEAENEPMNYIRDRILARYKPQQDCSQPTK